MKSVIVFYIFSEISINFREIKKALFDEGFFDLYLSFMITVEIEFYLIADEFEHFFGCTQKGIFRFIVNIHRNIGGITAFNVVSVERRTFFKPVFKSPVGHNRLFTEPCKVMSIEKSAVFIKKITFERFFDTLLTMKSGKAVAVFILGYMLCGDIVYSRVIKPVVITLAVGFV